MDREEFFRLKKVQGKKKRDAAESDAKKALENRPLDDVEATLGGSSSNMLEEKDEDIIF